VDDSKNLISLNRPIDLQSQQSIVKFTLCKADGTPINATALTICDISSGDKKLVESFNFRTMLPACGGLTITPTAATSEFYVAMCCRGSIDIQLLAETEDGIYSFRKNSVTFEIGKYYEIKVKMAMQTINLSTRNADYEAKDGETLTGTLASNVKISIAAGATVTLKDVNITNLGVGFDWEGITCESDATLVLEGTNTVCAGRGSDGYNNYPGIWIAPGKTLTIQGDGTLTAYSNADSPYAAGIGGGYKIACGNIVINSGTITATGGWDAAGIGGGNSASCGNITINGGTVTATGGNYGAGIGCGAAGENQGSCGNITISGGTVEATGGENAAGIGGGSTNGVCGTITITKGVTSVTATKGANTPNSIGAGDGGQDITVNIENGANVTQK
jgi:hypothetical protein